jgi:hypothetical protein
VSLGWQAATHVLTGGRVKVSLYTGAIGQGGDMALSAPSKFSVDWSEILATQGFTRPVVAVQAANIGRTPVTVMHWCLEPKRGVGVGFYPSTKAIGPALPCRLEAGESQTWAVDLASVHDLVTAIRETLGGRVKINGFVELADGRKRRSRGVIRPGVALVSGQSPPATARTPPPP